MRWRTSWCEVTREIPSTPYVKVTCSSTEACPIERTRRTRLRTSLLEMSSCRSPIEAGEEHSRAARAPNRSGSGVQCRRMTFTEGTSLRPLLGLLVLLLELLDPARGVDQLLLAGEERVAMGEDGDLDLLDRGHGLEGVPAGALDLRLSVFRVDIRFHRVVAPSVLTNSSSRENPGWSSSWISCRGGTPCSPRGTTGRGISAGSRFAGERAFRAGALPFSSRTC